MHPLVAPSARRHGVSDETMVHAYDNAVTVFEMDEGFTMLVGPDYDGTLVEVGVVSGN